LTSFVAEDSFLPRPLMKRGHRLVFSNGIITLTVLAVALLIATGGSLNALVPIYAIGRVHRLLDGRLWHDQTLADPSWARLALQAGDQPVGGHLVDESWWASSRSRSSPKAPGWWSWSSRFWSSR
jgi:hypothetical protein